MQLQAVFLIIFLNRILWFCQVAASGRGAIERLAAAAGKAGKGLEAGLEALDNRTGILTVGEAHGAGCSHSWPILLYVCVGSCEWGRAGINALP